VYDAEVVSVEPAPPAENGGLVDVVTGKGRFAGTGFYSEKSRIRVRIFSRNANDAFDEAFWRRRLQYAWDYRRAVLRPEELSCCRVIFGEADMLPGLTVDRFGGILVTQTLSVGIERIKPQLFSLLAQVMTESGETIDGIFERNDVAIREKEGLPQNVGWFDLPGKPHPASTTTEICENGVRYLVDFEHGQKTGFFLDQKYNRQAVARLARGKRVLDCFTHTGSFALNAAKGGAVQVTAVDVSEQAVELARANARLNGLEDRMEFTAANVFDLLPQLEQKGGHPYDFIILDPPAFTKSRKTVDSALRGYKEINLRAMKLLPRGGYLATCSCSHFAGDELFRTMLASAARDAGVELRQIEARQQAPDHPILWNVDETDYLKFYLFQVV
jgi:23S rRNA (cytosine1962-C5)-methyltransferase